ncbi:metallothionein expression activator [Podospora fimiseda]|uniref:Metallothionein expression activator n=1 Tax=Podospora fimiseda TaxID=252190 RepID=A0AAN7BWG6_9PEZI|nr:metallothionein expression activator [Podospora fimiseda]
MNASAASHLTHDTASSDWYDDLGSNSPRLEPLRPVLQPSPSPPPPIASAKVSSPVNPGEKRTKSRFKTKPSRGDAILIGYLGGHRSTEIADLASTQVLASEPESQDDTDLVDDSDSVNSSNLSQGGMRDGQRRASGTRRMSIDQPDQQDDVGGVLSGGGFDLKSLAATALATVADVINEPVDERPIPPSANPEVMSRKAQPLSRPPAPVPFPITARRVELYREERPARSAPISFQAPVVSLPPSQFSPPALTTPPSQHASLTQFGPRSPTNSITSSTLSESLAPLKLQSPRYDTNGQTLPSIRSQLGDFNQLANNHAVETARLGSSNHMFPRSPPPNVPPLHRGPGSPPTSPVQALENFRRDVTASGHFPLGYAPPAAIAFPSPNYSGSSTATPGSDQSASTPGAVNERMGPDGQPIPGTYVCQHQGCNAPPFTTQYLLNSHMNVHSSSRPHYCPVPGCSRAEGGKGFKRKNEMIRHGLVHDSPGYVCPFCPDREHKYPRPDNLQRHVRVHHVDKDKDDPLLRDVLAQRPDGPNRGRRRRGAPG